EAKGLVDIKARQVLRDPQAGRHILETTPLELMPQQADALETIKGSISTLKPPVILLHGVTGSGKTEVYLQAIQYALDQGKGAIVLVPEISLTPQMVERFVGRFGETIAVLHSHLSSGERHDEWHRVHRGKARIAVGARSALFAPVKNPGLIVVDEEHEHTYKQEETPRYNARDVAVMRGRLEKCSVVLGSATPALESYQNAMNGKYHRITMPHRVDHRKMPRIRIVDMRSARGKEGQIQALSPELVEAIDDRLNNAEQVMLFLNRRGFATSLICPSCGFVSECNQCSVSLTYHKGSNDLHCHVCGEIKRVPDRCPQPDCGDPAFKFSGLGIQRVEEVVKKIFTRARVLRMDSDTTTRKGSHALYLDKFRRHEVDILVGTQMIAKGLDFPNVTLVGVVYADTMLHMPDFRSGERTYQLLTQVAGRAGRYGTHL
ncbi:MAG: primosomal protein N', partial [Verrucomicrobiota bacterium]